MTFSRSEAEDYVPLETPLQKKKGLTVRRLMIAVAVSALLLAFVRPIYLIFDALGHGPYTVWYNRHCQRLADEANLIGRPERDIEVVLGAASVIWDYDDVTGSRKTYNYAPVEFVPAGLFQVHCRDGMVKSLEQLDD